LESNPKSDELTRIILCVVDEKSPQTVQELVTFVQEKGKWSNKEVTEKIMKLQAESKIRLSESSSSVSLRFVTYLGTNQALWYWATVTVAVFTAMFAFLISEDFYPWNYLRNFLGLIFVLWLPGYSILKVLFPINVANIEESENLSRVDRITLSIVISIALVALIDFILDFTPWGLNKVTAILSLLTFSLIFATAAIIREYYLNRHLQE
jgi:uncharacterized membrane protein